MNWHFPTTKLTSEIKYELTLSGSATKLTSEIKYELTLTLTKPLVVPDVLYSNTLYRLSWLQLVSNLVHDGFCRILLRQRQYKWITEGSTVYHTVVHHIEDERRRRGESGPPLCVALVHMQYFVDVVVFVQLQWKNEFGFILFIKRDQGFFIFFSGGVEQT